MVYRGRVAVHRQNVVGGPARGGLLAHSIWHRLQAQTKPDAEAELAERHKRGDVQVPMEPDAAAYMTTGDHVTFYDVEPTD